MITERERELLIAGYVSGVQEAVDYRFRSSDESVRKDACRWVDDPIADNGGTVGQYIGFIVEEGRFL